jgi:hypothetical protein
LSFEVKKRTGHRTRCVSRIVVSFGNRRPRSP